MSTHESLFYDHWKENCRKLYSVNSLQESQASFMASQNMSEICTKLNMHHVLTPVNYFFLVFGIQTYSYKGNKVLPKTTFSKAYSLLFSSVINIAFLYLISVKIGSDAESSTLKITFTDNISYFFGIFSVTSSLYIPVFSSSQLALKYMNNVEYIDNLLDLPQECYTTWRKLITGASLLLFAYICLANLLDIVAWYDSQSMSNIAMYIAMFTFDFLVFQYVVYIWMITIRMRALNSLLLCSRKQLNNINSVDFSSTNIMRIGSCKKMNDLMIRSSANYEFGGKALMLITIYDKLADNIDIINSSFGLQVHSDDFFSNNKLYVV